MNCPRTGSKLKSVKVGGITVFISESCGGVFFDNTILKSFEAPTEKRGQVLAKHLQQFHTELIDESKRINCPRCQDIVMMRRYYSPLHIVEIDECPGCGGIWLDSGELDNLRTLFLNPKERAIFRNQLIQETRPVDIRAPRSTYSSWDFNTHKIDNFIDITTYLLDE